MREYFVKSVDSLAWEEIPKAPIDNFDWEDKGYEPVCFAQLANVKGKGLAVKLTAYESNPLAVKKNYDDQVCEDSCLEFFVSFDSNEDYVNFETNSIGTLLAHVHFGGKKMLIDKLISIPEIKTEKTADYWSVEYMLSKDYIKKLSKGFMLESGKSFNANFYKCGDKTEKPHYGMWNKINHSTPSFHQPAQFGKIIIE